MNTHNLKPALSKFKKLLLGKHLSDGLIVRVIVYFLLIIVGFVFIYPILVMISYSFMSLEDLINPTIFQVPSGLYFRNYMDAFKALDYTKVFLQSLVVTLLPALIQTFIASLIGYGSARFEFPLKKLWMALVVIVYMIPPQVYLIPRFVLFNDLGILNNVGSVLVPATFRSEEHTSEL